ncbi:translocation/assembly module TamB domain-containing protein [Pseudooceanicola sp. LIPI14-2-Ac024]|uniref:translocation/assembly module TamB domain-containing protein n=1 Tax=Pseudooceanicola sp. LIPI14-2-Ac024 TaxID=3344875 RepID=UPI0035CF3B38
MFVRGRGLDAELRGEINIGGVAGDPRPVGQFDLVRGRLDVLRKRFDLTEGYIAFAGSFDPVIRLVAETTSDEYLIDITIAGSLTAPEVSFASNPALPEDEVLAQLFFGRDISELSTVQAASLAYSIAVLTGNAEGGVVGSIRDTFGLDDLDITQTEDGGTAIRAGAYISENVYADVEVTSTGQSTVSINLDLTDNVRASGKVNNDGDTSIGLYYERDY